MEWSARHAESFRHRKRLARLVETARDAQRNRLIVAGQCAVGVGRDSGVEQHDRLLDLPIVLKRHRLDAKQTRMAGEARQPGVGSGDRHIMLAGIGRGDGAIEVRVGSGRQQDRQPGPQRQCLVMAARAAEHVGQRADDLGRFALDDEDPAKRVGGEIELARSLRHQREQA